MLHLLSWGETELLAQGLPIACRTPKTAVANTQPPLTSLAFRNEGPWAKNDLCKGELGTECRGQPAIGRLECAWSLAQLAPM